MLLPILTEGEFGDTSPPQGTQESLKKQLGDPCDCKDDTYVLGGTFLQIIDCGTKVTHLVANPNSVPIQKWEKYCFYANQSRIIQNKIKKLQEEKKIRLEKLK